MDNLSLDPEVLLSLATIVENYCQHQQEIMNDYVSNVSSLSSEWTDEKTLGTLLEEIRLLKSNVSKVMEEIRTTYPQYFRDRAEMIRNRPQM